MTLLAVENLAVSFPTAAGTVRAVRGVSFSVDAGKTLGIVGESGSGKSVTAKSLVGLGRGTVTGSAEFDGTDLLTATPRQLRGIRGKQIAMIFQDPLSSLHPHYRVGWQIAEMIRAHERTSRAAARARAIELLQRVSVPEPSRRVDAYPHELSGGMRQRVMIAMALALQPRLLIADEPTTALDATVQAQIIQLLGTLQAETGMAMILITHDLGVIARIATDVLVMYAGRAVETATRTDIFHVPHHPYTCGLLNSIPASGKTQRLEPIAGQPPSLNDIPGGCAFHPRCAYAMTRCAQEALPPDIAVDATAANHTSACYLPVAMTGAGSDVADRRHEYARAHHD